MRHIKNIILSVFFIFLFTLPSFSAESSIRLIIFPFANITGDKTYNWVGDSFSESLTVGLNKLESLTIIERNQIKNIVKEQTFSKSGFVDDNQAIEMGKILSANIVVLGSFQIMDDQIKIIARFVDVVTGQIKKQHTAEVSGDLKKLFSLQAQLADKLIITFKPAASQTELSSVSTAMNFTGSLNAYEYYIKAKDLIYGTGTQKAIESAIEWLKKSIELDPNFTLAYIELSTAFSSDALTLSPGKEEYSKLCVQYAQTAMKMAPNSSAANFAMARAYLFENKKEEAIASLNTSIKLNPSNFESLILLMQLTKQKPEETINKLGDLLEKEKDNPTLNLFMGLQYINNVGEDEEMEKGINYLNRVIAKYPDNFYANLYLGNTYSMLGKFDIADKHILKALDLEPGSFITQSIAGLYYFAKGDLTKAEPCLKKSVELNPKWVYNQNILGIIYTNQGKFDDAIAMFNQAINSEPKFDQPYWHCATVYVMQKKYDMAEAILLQGVQNASYLVVIYEKLASVYRIQKKYTEALNSANKILTLLDPKDADYKKKYGSGIKSRAYFAMANVYRDQNQLDTALEYYDKAKNEDSENVNVYNALVDIYITRKQINEAASAYQKIVELEPQDADAYYNLSVALMNLKQYEKACYALINAIKYRPEHVPSHYNLGVVYWALGQYKESAQEWATTLKLDPDHQKAKEWLPKALEKLK